MRAAIYARVSTFDQEPENQLQEIRRYIEARGWTGVEFVDRGVSGAKDKRPALDALLKDAKRRRFRRAGLLEIGPARAESAASCDTARRPTGCRRLLRLAR